MILGWHSGVVEIGDGVFRLGGRHVNWYVVAEGRSVTIVDTGLPGHWSQLTDLLSKIGSSLGDIEAVLLTHAHPDHLGNAERLRSAGEARALIHRADESLATRQLRSSPPKVPIWRPPMLAFLFHGIRNGLTRWPALKSLDLIADGARMDVPGRPVAVHTPGHTAGSTCFAFDAKDVIMVGDALFNRDPRSGQQGYLVSPDVFSADHAAAVASLARLERLDHRTVLFGHGDPSHQSIRFVAEAARERLKLDLVKPGQPSN